MARERRKRMNHTPRSKGAIYPCKAKSVQALMVDLLYKGTTIPQAVARVNQLRKKKGRDNPINAAVIRSLIVHDVCTVKGYGVMVETSRTGKAFYKLVLPKGLNQPLPHKGAVKKNG